MEGIPAPDVADYKRRKEIELGLAAGSIYQPPVKRAKIESCPLTEEELRWQLAEHKALMGHGTQRTGNVHTCGILVVSCAPQTYPTPLPLTNPPMAGIPPPFLPLMTGFTPGYVILSTSLSLGSHVLAFRSPPSGFPTPGFPSGAPPFPLMLSPIHISTFPPSWNVSA